METLQFIESLLVHPFAMLLYGLSTHFLKKMIQFRSDHGNLPACPSAYFREYPYRASLSVIGAVAGYAAVHGTAQMTLMTAFGIGYMADSVADVIGSRSIEKV